MSPDRLAPPEQEPLVFVGEWLAQLKARFEHRPCYMTKHIFRVATWKSYESRRREIEEWVTSFTEPTRAKLIKRLRSSENHDHTYHELVIGMLLRDADLSISYEETVGGLTPDCYVRWPDGHPAMMVEVVSVDPPPDLVARQRAVSELTARLDELPIGVALGISITRSCLTPDSAAISRFVQSVKQWLTDVAPPVGAERNIDGVGVVVFAYDSGYKHAATSGLLPLYWVDGLALAETLSAKAKKYRDVAESQSLPLVVGLVTDSGSGHDVRTVSAVLNGDRVPETAADTTADEILSARHVCRKDALFPRRPDLSAVLYAWRGGDA